MIEGKILIEKLLVYARFHLYLSEIDFCYKRNVLARKLDVENLGEVLLDSTEYEKVKSLETADQLFLEIISFLIANGKSAELAERIATDVFAEITPLPSVVNATFKRLRETRGAKIACDYFYGISSLNNYVKKSFVLRNDTWRHNFSGKELLISINLAKPESYEKKAIDKDDNVIVESAYPKCRLCRENQGFLGDDIIPSRANLVTVDIELGKKPYFMQYSPYSYIDEHCVLINDKHTPMKICSQTIDELFDFIEYIPHYFIGSNADLPNIGGLILEHENYQGGAGRLPICDAKPLYELKSEVYPDVEICITDWVVTTLRLSGYNRNTIKAIFMQVIDTWFSYNESSVSIYNSENARHNSVSLIAHFLADGNYAIDIVFRNNATNQENPTGIFHVPQKYQNIKKTALGVMEVGGLFVLPARLKRECELICDILTDKNCIKKGKYTEMPVYIVHKVMIDELIDKFGFIKDRDKAKEIVKDYINSACVNMLYSCDAFRFDNEGKIELKKLLAGIGIK